MSRVIDAFGRIPPNAHHRVRCDEDRFDALAGFTKRAGVDQVGLYDFRAQRPEVGKNFRSARGRPDSVTCGQQFPGSMAAEVPARTDNDDHRVAFREAAQCPVGAMIPARLQSEQARYPGTFRSSSSSHTFALPSDGARQSPRGDRLPPDSTFGPFGSAERLYWLISKNR